MPGFDQTGPFGQGPMTGRRLGRCANLRSGEKIQDNSENDNLQQDSTNKLTGRGFGMGRGFGNRRGGRGRGLGRQNRFRGGF